MVALVAGTIFASLRETFISTVVPCTTCPFFGEMIESFAGLAGRSALTVGVGELVLGDAASLPHEPAAERQRWLEIPSGPSPNRVIINHRSVWVICGTCPWASSPTSSVPVTGR